MDFAKALKRLNPKQLEAVEAIDGPLLVIAGPGTGKTQLLSMRVANILKSTDTRAANILCLTFTNKSAVNMKERIIDLAGADGAKVAAKTFHSFAGEIMNAYPDYFWNAATLSVAPEPVQLDIIESIISQLPLDNPLALKFAGQYTLLGDIQKAINLAKDAGLTPDKLRSLISVNIAYIDEVESKLVDILSQRLSVKTLETLRGKIESLPKQQIDEIVSPLISLSTVIIESLSAAIEQDAEGGKTTATGKWKHRWVQSEAGQKGMFDERRRNAWWLELANVYEKYREQIHIRGFYDYADMLVETISQLEQNPEILADVQERFAYVMIDEFQDTNPAQLRLAHLVADHQSANGKPNLMAVGDDDQSIFKFNGAELNNMLGFKRTYPTAKIIVLSDNYRSSQAILDCVKKIIEQAQIRLVNTDKRLNKDLVAVNPPPAGIISARSYSSRELQMSEIAREIKKNYKPGRSLAVLARSHDSLIRMTGILQSLGVPLRYEQQSNILDHEIVNQVYLITCLLAAIQSGNKEDTDALVHQIVRHPLWGIEPRNLWDLALTNYAKTNWLNSLLNSRNKNLKAIGNWFVWLSQTSTGQPLAITIEQIIGLRPSGSFISPIKNYFTSAVKENTNNYFHGLSAIQLLRALVHEFAKEGDPKIEDLVRFIEINKNNGKIVPDESPFVTGGHAVQLLTVHKAKGLEFDSVYIIDATQDNWQPSRGSRKPPANLPLRPAQDDFDDYVRLMYVAATRAKSSLIISSYSLDHAGKDVAISPIVQGAFEVEKLTQGDPKKLIVVLEENLHWPQLSGGIEKEMLKARLDTYNLSVTHLLNFLDLTKGGPQYFKERNLLRLPEAKSASLSFGTAIHDALETAQRQVNKDSFDLQQINGAFAKSLTAQQLTGADYSRYQSKGRQVLDRLFNDLSYQLPKGSLPEQKLRDIKLERAVIGGKLDRVDKAGNKLVIVDYKTGVPLGGFETKNKAMAIKAYKHKLQLIFYALLAQESPAFDKAAAIEGQMVYVEAENAKDLQKTYTPTKAEIARQKQLIEAVWQKIINLDLPDVSSYPPDFEGILAFEADLISGKI